MSVLLAMIVLLPMVLNAHAGTRYGIPFPVFARAPFGERIELSRRSAGGKGKETNRSTFGSFAYREEFSGVGQEQHTLDRAVVRQRTGERPVARVP